MPQPTPGSPTQAQSLTSILRPLLPLAAVAWMVAVARLYGMLPTWSSSQWFLRRWDALVLVLATILALVAAELVRRWARRCLVSDQQKPSSWMLAGIGLFVAAAGAYPLLWQVNQHVVGAGKLLIAMMGFYLGVLLVSHEPRGGFFASVSGFFLAVVLTMAAPMDQLDKAGNLIRIWAILSLIGSSFSVYFHGSSTLPNRNPIPKAFVAAALCVIAINLSSFAWAGESSMPSLDYPLLLLALLACLALERLRHTENFAAAQGSSTVVARLATQSGFPLVMIAAGYLFFQGALPAQKAYLIGILVSAALGLALHFRRANLPAILRVHGADAVFLAGGIAAVLAFTLV
jgi:hypothetical protein